MTDETLIHSPLGKEVSYNTLYDPTLLFAVPRSKQRQTIGIIEDLQPFHGGDIWNAYEISWLNPKGKPQVSIGEFFVPCESPYITESKSLKLYLNSFYQTPFDSIEDVKAALEKDLSRCVGHQVGVKLISPKEYSTLRLGTFPGFCLDTLDIETNTYHVNPHLLKCDSTIVQEEFYSDLLKSNCLGTKQPDWASLYIHYKGPKINPESLLKYIISFRTHNEFGEHCIERIFMDLMNYCRCELLTVYGRYTRRGGIDLNPFRSNFEKSLANIREYRQ